MFTKRNQVTLSYYSYVGGVLSVHYDHLTEFSASLDILTERKSDTFFSLVFSFHNKKSLSSLRTILLSIMKIDNDNIIFNITNNKDILHSVKISETKEITTKIAKQTTEIFNGRASSDPYLTKDGILTQSRKLLLHFHHLSKEILDSSTTKKCMEQALIKINKILNAEIIEFNTIIELNKSGDFNELKPSEKRQKVK